MEVVQAMKPDSTNGLSPDLKKKRKKLKINKKQRHLTKERKSRNQDWFYGQGCDSFLEPPGNIPNPAVKRKNGDNSASDDSKQPDQ